MTRFSTALNLFCVGLFTANHVGPVTAFLSPKVRHTHMPSKAYKLIRSNLATLVRRAEESNDEESYGNIAGSESDLAWLKDAIDVPSALEPDGLFLMEAKQGISGFSVDPQRGFVVVLVGGDRATYAVISPKDKQEVQSAEALTMVQLAGGLDLGTPILPPDVLARLVAEETGGDTRDLRGHVKLLRVEVAANEDDSSQKRESAQASTKESTPERDHAIMEQGAKVAEAVRKLPGLEECTFNQVTDGMKLHANAEGSLDRQGFTELLHTLRTQINSMEPSKVKFNLVVSLNGDEELVVTAPSAVVGVGLSLRYNADVVVLDECKVEGFDVVEIASRFPAFRPINHLEEDAKIMDGFIPQMFNEVTAPRNDDKM